MALYFTVFIATHFSSMYLSVSEIIDELFLVDDLIDARLSLPCVTFGWGGKT